MIDTLTIHRGLCQCDSGCDKGCKSYDEMVHSTPSTEHTSGSNEHQTASPEQCTCEVCELGISMPMQEWLASDPRHPQIHKRIMTALASGEIQVQGEVQ